MNKLILFIAVIAISGTAYAGKKEDIAAAVNKECGKSITSDDVPTAIIREVFLTCSGGQKVDVVGCQIPCMKDNAGAVVGGN